MFQGKGYAGFQHAGGWPGANVWRPGRHIPRCAAQNNKAEGASIRVEGDPLREPCWPSQSSLSSAIIHAQIALLSRKDVARIGLYGFSSEQGQCLSHLCCAAVQRQIDDAADVVTALMEDITEQLFVPTAIADITGVF